MNPFFGGTITQLQRTIALFTHFRDVVHFYWLKTCSGRGEKQDGKMDYESNHGEDPAIFLDSMMLNYPASTKLDIYFDL